MTSTQATPTDTPLKLCGITISTTETPIPSSPSNPSIGTTSPPKRKKKRKKQRYCDTMRSIIDTNRTDNDVKTTHMDTIRKNTGGGKFSHGNLNRI